MVNCESAAEVEKEKQGQQHPDIERLILPGALIEGPLGFVSGFAQTRPDQAHVINEKQPDERGVSAAQAEPGQRSLETGEENGFAQGAGDIKKVVPKLKGPFDQGEGVNDRARPKNKDHAQARAHIKKSWPIIERQRGTRVLGQEIERDALDDAGKGELDVNDNVVEFAA